MSFERIAWCAKCESPQECDLRGCLACVERRRRAAEYARRWRIRLRSQGVCITTPKHGPPMPGYVRCARCVEVHRRSA